jgi:hypothetical protein
MPYEYTVVVPLMIYGGIGWSLLLASLFMIALYSAVKWALSLMTGG